MRRLRQEVIRLRAHASAQQQLLDSLTASHSELCQQKFLVGELDLLAIPPVLVGELTHIPLHDPSVKACTGCEDCRHLQLTELLALHVHMYRSRPSS